MKVIPASSKTVTVGEKPFEQIEAEWRDWSPKMLSKPDVVPVGWINASQLAAMKRISTCQAMRKLRNGEKSGELESKEFLVKDSQRNQLARVTHFRRIK